MSFDFNNASFNQQYTIEQKKLTQRINQSHDYYEILGVSSTATDGELKKAYKKMALLLHPDKNQAPGSTDAFKAVGKAFAVLSDQEKRQHYDEYGPGYVDATVHRRQRHSSSSYSSFDDYYEDEEIFDPQEIFNMFFNANFSSENEHIYQRGNTFVYNQHSYRQHNVERNQESGLSGWLRALPFLIFLMITFLSFFSIKVSPYSFVRTRDYPLQHVTSKLKVVYYVNAEFDAQYEPTSVSRKRIENRIESEYVENMRTSCYQERIRKETEKNRGIYFGSQQLLEKARKMRTPSCEKLEKLFHPK